MNRNRAVRRSYIGLHSLALFFVAAVDSSNVVAQPSLTAAEIVRRERASVEALKTYQGEWQVASALGSRTRSSKTMVQAIPSRGVSRIVTSYNGGGRAITTILVDDGRTKYSYSSQNNSWTSAPHAAASVQTVANSLRISSAMERSMKLSYELMSPSSIGGKRVHVIKVRFGAGVETGVTRTMTLYIDQLSFRRRKAVQAQSIRLANGKTMTSTVTTTIVKERVDAPIAASTFKFTPPRGSRRLAGTRR